MIFITATTRFTAATCKILFRCFGHFSPLSVFYIHLSNHDHVETEESFLWRGVPDALERTVNTFLLPSCSTTSPFIAPFRRNANHFVPFVISFPGHLCFFVTTSDFELPIDPAGELFRAEVPCWLFCYPHQITKKVAVNCPCCTSLFFAPSQS